MSDSTTKILFKLSRFPSLSLSRSSSPSKSMSLASVSSLLFSSFLLKFVILLGFSFFLLFIWKKKKKKEKEEKVRPSAFIASFRCQVQLTLGRLEVQSPIHSKQHSKQHSRFVLAPWSARRFAIDLKHQERSVFACWTVGIE